MSTKHFRTSADLVRFKTALLIECGACGNCHTMSGAEVAKAFGLKTLTRIQSRCKCSLCGAKEARIAVLSPPAPRH